ncbi:MAG: 6-phosphofructokinase [Defluviitaleaceae bacterium]|nr:6-phosphofructokinase [Defluviitaleaceae bacterium]
MKNLLVAQSGGPSSAINATLAGVCQYALTNENVGRIYGAKHGIVGVLEKDLVEIGETLKSHDNLERLVHTPASALGSCRFKLKNPLEDPAQYKQIFETFKEFNIGYFVYIGGNDSMDTVHKLSEYARENNYEDIFIMGAPKTIDNDLMGMCHSPGYASAAKYIAQTVAEIWQDMKVYSMKQVIILEIMGRHTGWLTASASYATKSYDIPSLIYLPEVHFNDEKFIADVNKKLENSNAVLVCVSEGVMYENGVFVSESAENSETDAFGHKKLTGTAKSLENIVKNKIGCKTRAIEFSLIQRCAAHLASSIDLSESKLLGMISAQKAIEGVSGMVPVLNRISNNPYKVEYSCVKSNTIAGNEKFFPKNWINAEGNGVTNDFIEYVRPLIGGDKDEKAGTFLGQSKFLDLF